LFRILIKLITHANRHLASKSIITISVGRLLICIVLRIAENDRSCRTDLRITSANSSVDVGVSASALSILQRGRASLVFTCVKAKVGRFELHCGLPWRRLGNHANLSVYQPLLSSHSARVKHCEHDDDVRQLGQRTRSGPSLRQHSTTDRHRNLYTSWRRRYTVRAKK